LGNAVDLVVVAAVGELQNLALEILKPGGTLRKINVLLDAIWWICCSELGEKFPGLL
jgi:hypothetical protein